MATGNTYSLGSIAPHGHGMPALGLGTWRSDKGKVKDAVCEAIRVGYRHIDAAQVYENQEEVAAGLEEAVEKGYVSKKDEVWVTSKIWNIHHRPQDVRPAAERILRELKLSKIHLVLIHWPTAFKKIDGEPLWPKDENGKHLYDDECPSIIEMWKEMEKLVEEGLVGAIGVSNFNEQEMGEILSKCKIKPITNQVECHPYLQQDELRKWLHDHDMSLTAYSPLGNLDPNDKDKPSPIRDETIHFMAKKYNKTTAQLIIRWHLQKGNAVIPKTVTLGRVAENADVYDFTISDEDMAKLAELGEKKKVRMVNPGFRAGGNYVFPN